tara:strand:- start:1422 stop:1772 length:351 start_codon:yes stop_codon:yes gene_type:complete
MRRVVIESPLGAPTDEERETNRQYARACCRESLLVYGEAPFASHLLYDQPGLLHDDVPDERELGIFAGLEYVRDADATVVYEDNGISSGMKRGIKAAEDCGRPIEYRKLNDIDLKQ